MSVEILAYVGAAVMVVLAILAYRYFRSTATYARRVRESHFYQEQGPLMVSAPTHLAPLQPPSPSAEPANEAPISIPDASEIEETSTASDADPDEDATPGIDSGADDPTSESSPDETEPTQPVPDDIGEESTVADDPESPIGEPAQGTTELPDVLMSGQEPEPVIEERAEEPVGEISPGAAEAAPIEALDTETATPDEPLTAIPDQPPAGQEDAEPEISDDGPEESVATVLNSATAPTPVEANQQAGYRLIEELEPPADPSPLPEATGSIGELLKELDEQLAGLPSGIELIDLPILERRQVARRREDLLSDRTRLLEQKKRGAHRRRKRSGATG